MKTILKLLALFVAATSFAAAPTNLPTLGPISVTVSNDGTLVGPTNAFFGSLTNSDGSVTITRLANGRLDLKSQGGSSSTNFGQIVSSNAPTLNSNVVRLLELSAASNSLVAQIAASTGVQTPLSNNVNASNRFVTNLAGLTIAVASPGNSNLTLQGGLFLPGSNDNSIGVFIENGYSQSNLLQSTTPRSTMSVSLMPVSNGVPVEGLPISLIVGGTPHGIFYTGYKAPALVNMGSNLVVARADSTNGRTGLMAAQFYGDGSTLSNLSSSASNVLYVDGNVGMNTVGVRGNPLQPFGISNAFSVFTNGDTMIIRGTNFITPSGSTSQPMTAPFTLRNITNVQILGTGLVLATNTNIGNFFLIDSNVVNLTVQGITTDQQVPGWTDKPTNNGQVFGHWVLNTNNQNIIFDGVRVLNCTDQGIMGNGCANSGGAVRNCYFNKLGGCSSINGSTIDGAAIVPWNNMAMTGNTMTNCARCIEYFDNYGTITNTEISGNDLWALESGICSFPVGANLISNQFAGIRIINNRLRGASSNNAITLSYSSELLIAGNQIEGVNYAITVAADNALISGNTIARCANSSIAVSGQNVRIVNNQITGSASDNTLYVYNSHDVFLEGNHLWNNAGDRDFLIQNCTNVYLLGNDENGWRSSYNANAAVLAQNAQNLLLSGNLFVSNVIPSSVSNAVGYTTSTIRFFNHDFSATSREIASNLWATGPNIIVTNGQFDTLTGTNLNAAGRQTVIKFGTNSWSPLIENGNRTQGLDTNSIIIQAGDSVDHAYLYYDSTNFLPSSLTSLGTAVNPWQNLYLNNIIVGNFTNRFLVTNGGTFSGVYTGQGSNAHLGISTNNATNGNFATLLSSNATFTLTGANTMSNGSSLTGQGTANIGGMSNYAGTNLALTNQYSTNAGSTITNTMFLINTPTNYAGALLAITNGGSNVIMIAGSGNILMGSATVVTNLTVNGPTNGGLIVQSKLWVSTNPGTSGMWIREAPANLWLHIGYDNTHTNFTLKANGSTGGDVLFGTGRLQAGSDPLSSDVALHRQAAGLWEIYDGTSSGAAYRDLVARSLFATNVNVTNGGQLLAPHVGTNTLPSTNSYRLTVASNGVPANTITAPNQRVQIVATVALTGAAAAGAEIVLNVTNGTVITNTWRVGLAGVGEVQTNQLVGWASPNATFGFTTNTSGAGSSANVLNYDIIGY